MTDFKLKTDAVSPYAWDVEFDESGDIPLVSDAEETAQNSKFRLQIIAGEMFDDTRKGVPWTTDMVNPGVSINAKKRILERVILSTPGAKSLNYINIAVDTNGKAQVNYEGVTTQGETFTDLLVGQSQGDGSVTLLNQANLAFAAAQEWQVAGINYTETMA